MSEQQVSVFMQDGLQGNRLRQREHNQIFVTAAMEKRRETCRFAASYREKWLHRGTVWKCQHHNRRRSHSLHPCQGQVGESELLEASCESRNLLCFSAAIDV